MASKDFTHVRMHHAETGQIMRIELGWSWTLFVLNYPLGGMVFFLRGMWGWGWFTAVTVIGVAIEFLLAVIAKSVSQGTNLAEYVNPWEYGAGYFVMWGVMAVLMGLIGNRLYGKHLLMQGWRIEDEREREVAFAIWKLDGK